VQARSRCYAGGLLLSLSAIPIIYVGIIVNCSADRSYNVGLSGLTASAPHDRPVSRQHENSRRAQHVQLPDQVEPGFCIDLEMCNALGHSGYLGEDPASSPAWRAERGRELQQRRAFPQLVPDVVAGEPQPGTPSSGLRGPGWRRHMSPQCFIGCGGRPGRCCEASRCLPSRRLPSRRLRSRRLPCDRVPGCRDRIAHPAIAAPPDAAAGHGNHQRDEERDHTGCHGGLQRSAALAHSRLGGRDIQQNLAAGGDLEAAH